LELSLRARIPNAISCSRIVLGLIILILATHLNRTTFVLIVGLATLAMVSDAVDGFLARRWNVASTTGYVLDTMGDRSIHLALILIVLVRYSFNPVYVWLLIFRDISIYAVRVLTPDWVRQSRQLRWLSVMHATILRAWLGIYLLREGIRIFLLRDVMDTWAFELLQTSLICSTIVLSYYGLCRSFSWLIDIDHQSLDAT
jgi:phosphatidylglycerophosphate synthase